MNFNWYLTSDGQVFCQQFENKDKVKGFGFVKIAKSLKCVEDFYISKKLLPDPEPLTSHGALSVIISILRSISNAEEQKTLDNTNIEDVKEKVSDVKVFGDGDLFKLISKASSKKEGWMKSTKVMEVLPLGCVVQVTTQQGDNVSEALTFIPGAKLVKDKNGNHRLQGMGYQ